MTAHHAAPPFSLVDIALRAAIVGLTLATASIHASLGGLLFTANAIGYVVFATAMVAPLTLASRFRPIVRLSLAGYATTTILAWAIQGPFYSTAYRRQSYRGRLGRPADDRVRAVRRQSGGRDPARASIGSGPLPRRVLTLERLQGLALRHGSDTRDRLPRHRGPHRLHRLPLGERAGARPGDRR